MNRGLTRVPAFSLAPEHGVSSAGTRRSRWELQLQVLSNFLFSRSSSNWKSHFLLLSTHFSAIFF